MKFDELDARMRAFETVRDPCMSPEAFIVARIDGRSFTRLTKEQMTLDKPFDATIRDAMVATVEHLMNCGFRGVYGYTESDEISLLFGRDADAFGRNIRKWTSILAGEASAAFSVRIGRPAAFDCRVIELPSAAVVVDYFRWRQEDANRNALSAWSYWTLRGEGLDAQAAAARLSGLASEEKRRLLAERGVDYETLPAWQKRGVGVVWHEYDKPGVNPVTGAASTARRRRLAAIMDLPSGEEYGRWIKSIADPS